MKNWATLEADIDCWMNKHYTPGRGNAKINKIVVHHNASRLTIQGIWNVWQTRQASAHYQVQNDGVIGQLVHDYDTAWHAGSANPTSIGIEHANLTFEPGWTISDACLDNGAHLVAALCLYYGLGRPTWGVNVFGHKSFASTACPGAIAGSQTGGYMHHAQQWYDKMLAEQGSTVAATTPAIPSSVLSVGSNTTSRPTADIQRLVGADPDGVYGVDTTAKVVAWQAAHGLTPDGIWGPMSDAAGFPPAHAVKSGNLEVDGIVGPETVKAYQRRRGLLADGIMGPATVASIQALVGASADGVFDGQNQDLIAASWPALTSYNRGGEGSPGVAALQSRLGTEPDGLLGPDTARAFQAALNEGRI